MLDAEKLMPWHAGQEIVMDFIGKMVHTKYMLFYLFLTYLPLLLLGTYKVHTCTDLRFCRERASLGWENRNKPPRRSSYCTTSPSQRALGSLVQCSHWLPGYAAVVDQPYQELHH
jgi:hypothetical protein